MYTHRQLIKDIWRYITPYRKDFYLSTALKVLIDLVWLYPPYATALIINFFSDYTPGESLKTIYIILALSLLVVVIRFVGMYYCKTWAFQLSERTALDVQNMTMRHLVALDISWHEKENTGTKFKRLERGAVSIHNILRLWINHITGIFVNLVGVVLIVTSVDRSMGIAFLFFFVTFYFVAHYYRKNGTKAVDVVSQKQEVRSGMLFESINNVRSVKVMSMAGKIIDKLSTNATDMMEAVKNRIYWFQAGNSVRSIYANIFNFIGTAYIIYGVIHGQYEIGFLVLFGGYFGTVWKSMSDLADVAEEYATGKNAVERMQVILNTPITIDIEEGKVKFPNSWEKLSLKDITFSYDNKRILDRISFEIKRGEKIGIIGLSGAGKSTLFKLLLKEHESYTGSISFDGIPLTTVSKKDYFNHMAVVLQETELFNASLRENITITNRKEENNMSLIDKAIEIAHVKDFMSKLPDGMNSVIGEKGIKLSGGEKQRVGMARAIFKQPQILLLDEATSHLDIESEEKIQDSLHKFFQSVTAIVIAHRLTTIKEMDRIIVLEHGKIVESGSFTELYKKKGRFHELWEKQKI